nr:hypothetical protein [Tanacetum cinerariifolium]
MLAPGNYVQWKSRIKRYIDTKPNHELIHYCLENPPYKLDWQDIEVLVFEGSPITTTARIHETYKNVSKEIRDQLNAKVKVIQIILIGIDNDIYSTVDACPNACEMWKAIERLKQDESINVQDLKTNMYWEFGKFTSQDGESLELYYSRSDGYENKRIGNVAGARENVGSSMVQKSGIQCYNCKEFGHVARECQKPKRAKDAAYHREKMLLYAADSGPIFDDEPIQNPVEILLFIVDSGCSKHMTRNLKLLINFMEKFLGTVKFGNDQIAPILGYGDLVQGAVTITRVYYVEGLNHNLFFVGQLCNADLEVAFRKSTCFIRDLKGNDLFTGSRDTNLYSITLQDTNCPNPICLMAKATSSQAWLWHRRLSHLNFDTINLLSKNDIVATRTMLSVAKVPLFFWAEAIATACFTQNRSLVIPRHEKTSYHFINDSKPSVKFFHIFGSICYIVRDGENLDKMKDKGDECIFVRYSNQSRAYRVFNKRTRLIMESIHVNFDELPHMASDQITSDPAPECQRMALNHDSLSPAIQRQENVPQADRTVTMSNELDLLFSPVFDELLNGSSKVVSKSSTVSATDAPNQRQLHTTLLNNHTTPAPTCQVPTLAPTVTSSENINQAETTRRQLESDAEMCMFALTEEVYVNQPDGFVDPYHPDKVYRLKKSLYGLKQAPRAWYDELSKFLLSKGFSKGIQIYQSPRGIFINQAKYAQEILKKYGMTSCDNIGIPMATKHLDADLSGTPVDQTTYRSKVEALMYLTASRPDIMHETCYCARYQAQPTEKHLTAVKRIFCYLKDTINMGLWYPKDNGFELTAFLDSNHAGCFDLRKSTSSGIQFLSGDKLVSWSSKKQDCTLMSSVEVEYVSLFACCAQVLWMRTQLTYYGFYFDKISMYCDSKAAIAISCDPVQHSHTKHIDVRYHFIKKKVEKGIVELFFVRTEYQLTDLFTKALPVESFKYLVRRLGTLLIPDQLLPTPPGQRSPGVFFLFFCSLVPAKSNSYLKGQIKLIHNQGDVTK